MHPGAHSGRDARHVDGEHRQVRRGRPTHERFSARLRQGWLNLEYPAHGPDRPTIGVVADGLTLISAPPRRCRPPFYTSRPRRTVQLMLQSRNLRCRGPLFTAAAAYLVLKPLAIVHSRRHPPFARSAIAKCPRRAPPASLARPLLSSKATASRSISGENSLLIFATAYLIPAQA